jgi:hypothetical protein
MTLELALGPYVWVTPDVRAAFELLDPEQRAAYVKLVRAQYRSDVRERAHAIVEADLGSSPASIADGRLARSTAGAGGGLKRGVGEQPEQ